MGGLAEFERELTKIRTMEGRDQAKRAGVKIGRKPTPIRSPKSAAEKQTGNLSASSQDHIELRQIRFQESDDQSHPGGINLLYLESH
jgi:DNA invertase Pin-like site-specific DNA recombinase